MHHRVGDSGDDNEHRIFSFWFIGLGAEPLDGIDRLNLRSICTSNEVEGNRHIERFFWIAMEIFEGGIEGSIFLAAIFLL